MIIGFKAALLSVLAQRYSIGRNASGRFGKSRFCKVAVEVAQQYLPTLTNLGQR